VRDPDRTRKAVLDAAEGLFARKGYATTSLQEIGREAGVSRNTPSYFFGSKEGLYVAVKKRLADGVRAFAQEAGAARAGEEERDPREAIAEALRSYVDFLAANPNYVRLVEREASGEDAALEGASSPDARMAESLGSFGLEVLEKDLRRGPFREVNVGQLAASMIALCSFPFLLGGGLIRTLGINPDDRGFVEARKEHVVDLLMRGILERGAHDAGERG
jgi:AcrR family transcriptional regulator